MKLVGVAVLLLLIGLATAFAPQAPQAPAGKREDVAPQNLNDYNGPLVAKRERAAPVKRECAAPVKREVAAPVKREDTASGKREMA